MNSYRTCGICGARVAFLGSHTIREHTPYLSNPDAITSAVNAARSPFVIRALANSLPAKEL